MGCVTATAKRRRTQAKMGYRHLAKKQRPTHKRKSPEAVAKKNQAAIDKLRAIAARKGQKK